MKGDNYNANSIGYGVWGIAGFGSGVYGSTTGFGWGVFGASNGPGIGVRGTTTGNGAGVQGVAGPNGLGVSGMAGAGGAGVYFSGGLAGTGTKSFIEPHRRIPRSPSSTCRLEGREAGTYFRGRAKFERGLATIRGARRLSDGHRRKRAFHSSDAIGEMANSAVVRIDLRR